MRSSAGGDNCLMLVVFNFYQNFSYVSFNDRQPLLYSFPDYLVVDAEIPVDELIPHFCHVAPWNFYMLLFDFQRDILGRLSNYLKLTNNSTFGFIITYKRVKIHLSSKALYLFYTVNNVLKIKPFTPHTYTTSLRIMSFS